MFFENHLVFRIVEKAKTLLFLRGTFSMMKFFIVELTYVRNHNMVEITVYITNDISVLLTADSEFHYRVIFLQCFSDFLSCFADLLLDNIHLRLIRPLDSFDFLQSFFNFRNFSIESFINHMIIFIKELFYFFNSKPGLLKVLDLYKRKSLFLFVISITGPLIHFNRFQ